MASEFDASGGWLLIVGSFHGASGSFFVYRMQMKHIVEPLFVSHCILVQYCFLSFVSIILRHLCPIHQVRTVLLQLESLEKNTPHFFSLLSYINWYPRSNATKCRRLTLLWTSIPSTAEWLLNQLKLCVGYLWLYSDYTFICLRGRFRDFC